MALRARAFRKLSRSAERQPEVHERRGEGGGVAEEMADEAGALGALDIAGAVVDEHRRPESGAETGEAAEIGGLLGFSRAELGRDEDIGPKDRTERRKDGIDRALDQKAVVEVYELIWTSIDRRLRLRAASGSP